MNRFSGQTAVVTGAASGIGAASAARLAREGAAVVVADIAADAGEAVAARIREEGGRAAYVRCDVSSEADWTALRAETHERGAEAQPGAGSGAGRRGPATPRREGAPARPSPLGGGSSPPAPLRWPGPVSPAEDVGDAVQGAAAAAAAAALATGQPARTVDGPGSPPRPASHSSPKSSDKSKSFSIDSILAGRQGQEPAGGAELPGGAKPAPRSCLGASLLATSASLPPPFNASLMLDPHVQGGFYQLGIPFLSYFPLQLPDTALHFSKANGGGSFPYPGLSL